MGRVPKIRLSSESCAKLRTTATNETTRQRSLSGAEKRRGCVQEMACARRRCVSFIDRPPPPDSVCPAATAGVVEPRHPEEQALFTSLPTRLHFNSRSSEHDFCLVQWFYVHQRTIRSSQTVGRRSLFPSSSGNVLPGKYAHGSPAGSAAGLCALRGSCASLSVVPWKPRCRISEGPKGLSRRQGRRTFSPKSRVVNNL